MDKSSKDDIAGAIIIAMSEYSFKSGCNHLIFCFFDIFDFELTIDYTHKNHDQKSDNQDHDEKHLKTNHKQISLTAPEFVLLFNGQK